MAKSNKKTTAIATISNQKALDIVSVIKSDIKAGADIIQTKGYAIGQRIQYLKDANAHILVGAKSFNDYLDSTFSDVGVGHSMLGKYANAYHHLKDTVPADEFPAWSVAAVGEVKWAKHDEFVKRVRDNTFTPTNFTLAMARDFNKEGKTEVIPTFARFYGAKPVETENGIELLTEEEVKANKPTASDKSMTVCTFSFRDNMERKVIVYANVNKANLCISSSVWYREYTSADVDAYHAKQGNDAKREARIAKLRKDGWSEEDIAEMLG